MEIVTADTSRIDGGVVRTWTLKPGAPVKPVWAGPTPLRMVLVTGIFGGARVGMVATITPEGDGPFVPVYASEGLLPFSTARPGGAVLSPFGLWLRPKVAGGDETTEVVVTLALVNPAHQRAME